MIRSLYSGVSGMKAHQARMDVIGNNIANVNTYGFKSGRASFSDVYYQTISAATGATNTSGGTNPSQIGYGVQLGSVDTIQTRATFSMTDNALDLAIAGEGFFQVQDSDGNTYYTRAGQLSIDATGNLVDSNGNFVLGVCGDPLGKSPSSSKIQIAVPNVQPSASTAAETINGVIYTIKASNQTTDGNVTFNFESDPTLPGGQPAQAFITSAGITIKLNASHRFGDLSELNDAINDAVTEANGGVQHSAGIFTITTEPSNIFPGTGLTGEDIISTDYSTTLGSITGLPDSGVFGGIGFMSVSTDFSSEGVVTFNPAIYEAEVASGDNKHAEGWSISMDVDGTTYTGYVTKEMTASGSFLMKNTDGNYVQMTHPGLAAVNVAAGIASDSSATLGDTIAAPIGDYEATASKKSEALGLGSTAIKLEGGTEGGSQTVADLSSISIGADGAIEAIHAMHGRIQLGRIDLATFVNPQGLEQSGNTYFVATANSGEAQLAIAGSSGSGALATGSLEMSNVDLSKEFADIITTQRGFQANSRMITVSDTMLEELINLKR